MNDPSAKDAETMPPPPPRMTTPVTQSNVTTTITNGSDNDEDTLSRNAMDHRSHKHRTSLEGLPPRHPPNKQRRVSVSDPVPYQPSGDYINRNENNSNNNNNNIDVNKSKDGKDEQLENAGEEEDDSSKKRNETLTELDQEVNSMMKMGLQAFQDRERLQREITTLKDDNAAKGTENVRLRTALKQKQEIITNLLQAVETSKTETRRSSSSIVAGAALRVELAQVTEEKNQALMTVMEQRRRVTQLEQTVAQTKAKLTRVTQEKFKLEREQRVAQQVARNVDQQSSTDVEFHKRKVSELTGQIQSLNAIVMEKNRLIEDMQRQIERSLSRQAVAQQRSVTNNNNNNNKTNKNPYGRP